jgi:hypothetical protein
MFPLHPFLFRITRSLQCRYIATPLKHNLSPRQHFIGNACRAASLSLTHSALLMIDVTNIIAPSTPPAILQRHRACELLALLKVLKKMRLRPHNDNSAPAVLYAACRA